MCGKMGTERFINEASDDPSSELTTVVLGLLSFESLKKDTKN